MVAMVSVFLIYPAIDTIWISFTRWNAIGSPKFIGLANYVGLFADPGFVNAVVNTCLWVIGVMVLQVGLGLALAVLVNASPLAELYKRVLYLPATLSGAVTGIVWYFVFDPDLGLLNSTLRLVGLGSLAHSWLSAPPLNTVAMIFAGTWQGLGPTMVLFLIGLQNIPRDPIEAAMVDGATGWQMFRHITLPLLQPMTLVVVTLALIGSLKVFDIVWVMTRGGPYQSSETLAVTMYRESFVQFDLGPGAALAVVLTILVSGLAFAYLWQMFQRVDIPD
jgi:multiple sugar transport system permease protein